MQSMPALAAVGLASLIGFLAPLALRGPAVTQAQAGPAAVLSEFHDTLNAGDVQEALAFFTDDGVFQTSSGQTFTGKQGLQMFFQRQVSQNRRVDIVSSEVSDGTVTASVEVRSSQITACGAERILATETVTFEGEKISQLVVQDDLSDAQTADVLDCNQGGALPGTGGQPAGAPAALPGTVVAGLVAIFIGVLFIALGARRRA